MPWLLWQMLLRLDDLAEQGPQVTPIDVFNAAIALLSLLAALVPLLRGQ